MSDTSYEKFAPCLQHIRDIQDPEHPYSLEQLNVVSESLIDVSDDKGAVACVPSFTSLTFVSSHVCVHSMLCMPSDSGPNSRSSVKRQPYCLLNRAQPSPGLISDAGV